MSKKCPIGFANDKCRFCDDQCILNQNGCLIAKALTVYVQEHEPLTSYQTELTKENLRQALSIATPYLSIVDDNSFDEIPF